jgi:hypothetical protein
VGKRKDSTRANAVLNVTLYEHCTHRAVNASALLEQRGGACRLGRRRYD